jgi:universal stress protein family protein
MVGALADPLKRISSGSVASCPTAPLRFEGSDRVGNPTGQTTVAYKVRSHRIREYQLSFKRILIAVDESAFAAHAADVGIELAKSLKAEIAFICAVDPSVARAAAEIGVPADKLIAFTLGAGGPRFKSGRPDHYGA